MQRVQRGATVGFVVGHARPVHLAAASRAAREPINVFSRTTPTVIAFHRWVRARARRVVSRA
jgi:hypothetical protein